MVVAGSQRRSARLAQGSARAGKALGYPQEHVGEERREINELVPLEERSAILDA